MDPGNGGDLLHLQEGSGQGGAGHGRCPVEVGGGDLQDPPRVPAGRDNEEEQGGARALLAGELPFVVGTPGPEEGGGQARVGPAAGRVSGLREGRAPGGYSGESPAHDGVRGGVRLVPSYTGLVKRGRVGVSPPPSTNIVTSRTSKSSSGGCRRWSAASSSDIPLGYVARVWFRYGAAPMGWRVLRACSRRGALLWREVADPSPVSRRVSPMDRGRPDRLDVRHSIQYP